MQGFNMGRYRPPDADPRAQSFNSLTGTNPYGKRGRKLDAGILVVRFELPFNIWCGLCQTHIGQGVRFNAEKTKVGNYYSTPIFRFRCKTTCCQHHFEIETDPKHARYVVVSGAKAQAQPGDEGSSGGGGGEDGLLVLDDGTGDRGAGSSLSSKQKTAEEADPFAKLEQETTERRLVAARAARLEALEEKSRRAWADPYERNRRLRDGFRADKHVRQARDADDAALRQRLGWATERPLVPRGDIATPDARRLWIEARNEAGPALQRRGRGSSSSSSSSSSRGGEKTPTAAQALAARLASTTRRKQDPFAIPPSSSSSKKRRP